MNTEKVKVDPEHIDEDVILHAGEILKEGGLVAFPTETVYGLGGDALRADASKKIYAAKGRPSDNPLIVHIADLEHLEPIAGRVPEQAVRLAEHCWPGPLTMIFEKTDLVPLETTGGLETVAVRMPVHPVAAALIRASGGYIAAPSANTSGRPSPTTAQHVIDDLDGKIDMIIDGGPSNIGLESTIVDFTEDVPVILRPGYINREMLENLLGEVRIDPGILDANANKGIRPKAPGMRYRHYAPRAPLTVVEGSRDAVTSKILELVLEAESHGKKAGILATDETRDIYERALRKVQRKVQKEHSDGTAGLEHSAVPVIMDIGDREEEETIARNLFAVLRGFDDAGVEVIYSEAFETPRMGMAIMNRLLKAAGHQVIRV